MTTNLLPLLISLSSFYSHPLTYSLVPLPSNPSPSELVVTSALGVPNISGFGPLNKSNAV